MIIGISGKMASGKDAAATYLQQRYPGTVLRFADGLKQEAHDLIFRLTGENVDTWNNKTARVRRFLQMFGTELMREWKESVWVDLLLANAERVRRQHPKHMIYVPDTRFLNEASAILTNGGVVLRIEPYDDHQRVALVHALYGEDAYRPDHPSETALDAYLSSFYVVYQDYGPEFYANLDAMMTHVLDKMSSRVP